MRVVDEVAGWTVDGPKYFQVATAAQLIPFTTEDGFAMALPQISSNCLESKLEINGKL